MESFKQLLEKREVKEIPKVGAGYFFIYSDKRLYLVVNGIIRQKNKTEQRCLLIFDTACGYETSQSNPVWFSSSVDPIPLKDKFCYAMTKEMFDDTRCVLDEVSIGAITSRKSFAFTRQKQHIFPMLKTIRENNLTAGFRW